LILSEFAGAAQSLGAGSIRVNPWHLQDTANAIYEALTMAVEERQALHDYAFKYVSEAWIFGKKHVFLRFFWLKCLPQFLPRCHIYLIFYGWIQG